jgi:hypothetical protein
MPDASTSATVFADHIVKLNVIIIDALIQAIRPRDYGWHELDSHTENKWTCGPEEKPLF